MGVIKLCIILKIYCKFYNSVVIGSIVLYCIVLLVIVLLVIYRFLCRDVIDRFNINVFVLLI